FVEEVFALPSLGTTDARADDLSDCFDFTKPPRSYAPIATALSVADFIAMPPSDAPPDDD
ncbi:MAG: hypothetical protein QOD51_371, partial [Candidatus Eremiobacteraeota bacterium]|nr:hypothetical protein [Candidatus Eremiobacteraeota bacterium]